MDAWTWSLTLDLVSYVVTALVGVLVGLAAPRERANQGYFLWALGAGFIGSTIALILFAGDINDAGVWSDAIGGTGWMRIGSGVAMLTGMVLLAANFPRPVMRAEAPLVVAAVLLALTYVALTLTWALVGLVEGEPPVGFIGSIPSVTFSGATTWAVMVLLALRAARAGDPKPHAIMTLALMFPAIVPAAGYLYPTPGLVGAGGVAFRALGVLTIGGLALCWGLVLWRHGSRWAIAVLWGLLGTTLLAWIALGQLADPSLGFLAANLRSLGRLAGTLLLAFLIVRGQVPGLERRARWGVSRGTIAAAFIAVFFVTTEAAQQFFGESLGSTYVGIAAAGGLVFLFAPLQRLADRLAGAALAAPAAAPASPSATAVEAYRAAVRAAMRDGVVQRREELHLAQVAQHLGLGAHDAARLRHEVEDAEGPGQSRA